jgi:hypothetical protein
MKDPDRVGILSAYVTCCKRNLEARRPIQDRAQFAIQCRVHFAAVGARAQNGPFDQVSKGIRRFGPSSGRLTLRSAERRRELDQLP